MDDYWDRVQAETFGLIRAANAIRTRNDACDFAIKNVQRLCFAPGGVDGPEWLRTAVASADRQNNALSMTVAAGNAAYDAFGR